MATDSADHQRNPEHFNAQSGPQVQQYQRQYVAQSHQPSSLMRQAQTVMEFSPHQTESGYYRKPGILMKRRQRSLKDRSTEQYSNRTDMTGTQQDIQRPRPTRAFSRG